MYTNVLIYKNYYRYTETTDELKGKIQDLEQQKKAKFEEDLKIVGPCQQSLNNSLKTLGVERQAYHSQSFIGNHCHKLLKVNLQINNLSVENKTMVIQIVINNFFVEFHQSKYIYIFIF